MKKLKVLFLSANPDGTEKLRLDEEVREITQKIRLSEFRDAIELVSAWAVRADDLLQALNEHRPDIVHFSGHGNTTGGIFLEDGSGSYRVVSAEALKALFQALRDNIKVVILNACYSETQAMGIIQSIDCAIGMSTRISDQAAIRFAASFYRAVGFGRSVQESFEQGRTALLLEGIPEENTPVMLAKAGVDLTRIYLLNQTAHTPSVEPVHDERSSQVQMGTLFMREQATQRDVKCSWDEIKQRSADQCRARLREFSQRYVQNLYQPRKIHEEEFIKFLLSDQRIFLVVGGSGTGKTNLLCHLAGVEAENTASLLYNCADISLDLENQITTDLTGGILPLAEVIADLQQQGRQIVLFFDALNEFRPDPAELLEKIYSQLLKPSASGKLIQGLKIVITTRHETWYHIKLNLRWLYEFYRPSNRAGLDDVEMELGEFTRDELKGAYAVYQRHYHLKTDFQELSLQVRNFISDPLLLRLVAETHKERAIPAEPLTLNRVFKEYIAMHIYFPNVQEIVRLKETIISRLVDEMYTLRTDEINCANLTDEQLKSLLNDRGIASPYTQLLDAGILVERSDEKLFGESRKLRFAIERLFEYLLSEVIFPAGVTLDSQRLVDLMEEANKRPSLNLWGAIKVGLAMRASDPLFLQLAQHENPLVSSITTDALLALHIENAERVEILLKRLLYVDSLKSKRVAIRAAYEIRKPELLLEAILDENDQARWIALEYITFLFPLDRQAVMRILEGLKGKIKGGAIGLVRSRKELSALLLLTVALAARYIDHQELIDFLVTAWHGILQSVSLDKRSSLLNGVFDLSINLMSSALAANTSVGVIDLKEIDEFFKLPDEERQRIAPLAPYVDPANTLDEAAQEQFLALSQIPNGMIFTHLRVIISVQALFHWSEFQPFIIRLVEEGNDITRFLVEVGLYNCFLVREWVDRQKVDEFSSLLINYYSQTLYNITTMGHRKIHTYVPFRIGLAENQLVDGTIENLAEFLDETLWRGDQDYVASCSIYLADAAILGGRVSLILDLLEYLFSENLAKLVPAVDEMLVETAAKIRVCFPDEVDNLLENWWNSKNEDRKRFVTRVREYRQEIAVESLLAMSMENLTGAILWRFPAVRDRFFKELLFTRWPACKSSAEAFRLVLTEIYQLLNESMASKTRDRQPESAPS